MVDAILLAVFGLVAPTGLTAFDAPNDEGGSIHLEWVYPEGVEPGPERFVIQRAEEPQRQEDGPGGTVVSDRIGEGEPQRHRDRPGRGGCPPFS